MSRTIVYRNLPCLEEAVKSFAGFPSGVSRQQTLTDELRRQAKRLRRSTSTPFWSMREVAAFFGVPLGTVSVVYQALEREGILNRLRGAQTLLMGKSTISRNRVRGLVGLPIWLHSIMVLPYTRTFTMTIEEQLRQRGYVANVIFHHTKDEELSPEFALRLLRHKLDVVIWQNPSPGTKQNILSLRERGVRVLLLQRGERQTNIPAVVYQQDFQTAYQEMANKWKKSGVRRVLIWSPVAHLLHGKSEIDTFRFLMEQCGLATEVVEDTPGELLARLRKRGAAVNHGIAFLDTTSSEQICNRDPQIIEEIGKHARLAFCVSMIRCPYLHARGVRADVVTLLPVEIASRLSADISKLAILPDGVQHTFTARYFEDRLIGGDIRDPESYDDSTAPESRHVATRSQRSIESNNATKGKRASRTTSSSAP